jgi:hypothetical protein
MRCLGAANFIACAPFTYPRGFIGVDALLAQNASVDLVVQTLFTRNPGTLVRAAMHTAFLPIVSTETMQAPMIGAELEKAIGHIGASWLGACVFGAIAIVQVSLLPQRRA